MAHNNRTNNCLSLLAVLLLPSLALSAAKVDDNLTNAIHGLQQLEPTVRKVFQHVEASLAAKSGGGAAHDAREAFDRFALGGGFRVTFPMGMKKVVRAIDAQFAEGIHSQSGKKGGKGAKGAKAQNADAKSESNANSNSSGHVIEHLRKLWLLHFANVAINSFRVRVDALRKKFAGDDAAAHIKEALGKFETETEQASAKLASEAKKIVADDSHLATLLATVIEKTPIGARYFVNKKTKAVRIAFHLARANIGARSSPSLLSTKANGSSGVLEPKANREKTPTDVKTPPAIPEVKDSDDSQTTPAKPNAGTGGEPKPKAGSGPDRVKAGSAQPEPNASAGGQQKQKAGSGGLGKAKSDSAQPQPNDANAGQPKGKGKAAKKRNAKARNAQNQQSAKPPGAAEA